MPDSASGKDKWLWEDGTGIALEDGSGVWILETLNNEHGAVMNNYQFASALSSAGSDNPGMISMGEKIR